MTEVQTLRAALAASEAKRAELEAQAERDQERIAHLEGLRFRESWGNLAALRGKEVQGE